MEPVAKSGAKSSVQSGVHADRHGDVHSHRHGGGHEDGFAKGPVSAGFFRWPNLAKAGFGTCQIRQILARLFQVGIGAGNLAQGLTYAEWELEHGTMRDKNGEPVSHPLNWVFSSLARTGYYRRPQGYISPQEQAEIDATVEEERLKKAREARKKSAFEAWCAGLSPQEKMPLRVTPEEKDRLREHTALMGVSLSAYVRTKIFGGRPLIPRTDECTIRGFGAWAAC